MTTTERDETGVAALQRRTLGTLVAGQAVGAMGITIGIATASLLARDLSGSEKLAGLAQTFQVLGTALAALLLARVMHASGRRVGLVVGYLLGAAGAVLAVLAGVAGSMPLLLAGAVLLGATSAANAASRYAATDLAPDATRARALSLVVWATTIGAVLGPNLTGVSSRVSELLGIPELTGPFALGSVAMLAAAAVIWVRLRPDPLLVAREQGRAHAPGDLRPKVRVAEVVRARPVLATAIVGMSSAHAVMVSVMVMTPLHMEHGGAGLEVIGFVISVHVLGMFALSPVVGWAADRFGRASVLAAGGVVLMVSLALAGSSPEGSSARIFAGLFLLGLGWSCATVASSALIADHAPLEGRTQVQGSADMLMSLTAAGAGGLAGLIVGVWGYAELNLFAAVLAAATLGAGYAAFGLLARSTASVVD